MDINAQIEASTATVWTRRGLVLRGLALSGIAAVANAWPDDSVDAKKKRKKRRKRKKKGSSGGNNPPAHAEVDAEEQEFLNLINRYRAQHKRAALSLNSQLNAAAAAHSLDMGLHNYFSHIGKSKRSKDPG
ncbi:MAG: CAP domain-containing protein, partial [Chloroflexota bacterium]|nr:CAP domain-containing protein [Chloroflexota bacterium]